MGLGREVADAYIEVHGDLSDFRKDLEKAQGDFEKLAKRQAKDFSEAFGEEMQRGIEKKWGDLVKTMHSGDKLDFKRLISNFDIDGDLNAAEERMKEFMLSMRRHGKFTAEEYAKAKTVLFGYIDAMHLEEEQAQQLAEVQRELADMQELHNKKLAERAAIMAEAIKDNEAWARTFEGIRKNDAIKRMNDDFEKLSKIMKDADVDKFMKGFSSFDEMRGRVNEVTDAMRDMGRISKENSEEIRAQVNMWIFAREEEIRLEGEALDAARRLREEQERYAKSLDGMVQAAHFKKVEEDFKRLTDAIGTADFSKFGEGATSLQEFRDRVIETAGHMRNFGKINDEEFGKIISHLDKVSLNLGDFNVKLDASGRHSIKISSGMSLAGAATQRMGDMVQGLDPKMFSIAGAAKSLATHMAGTVAHFKGLAGLNVLGDMVQQGLDIAKNIDRVALNMGGAALKIGSAASLIITGAGGLINVAADIGSMAGIGWLAPGFLAAAGIQIGVLVAAFKDMKTRLKDLGPQFSELQDNISDAFWDQAEQPIRNLVDSLMPTLKTQLKDTSTQLGGMFKALADGFTKNATPERVQGMFEKMNEAIGIAKGAMEPLTSALVTLGEHASDYFKGFAEGIVGMSEDFDEFVTAAAEDGRLKQWTDDAIDAFKDTGRAIGGIAEIFGGINEAAEAAGIGGLKEAADSLERLADIANSPEFQDALTTYFEGAKAGADQIIDAIDQRLFPALGNIAPTMSTAMDLIGEAMGKAIGYISDIIEDPQVQEGILALSQSVTDAMSAIEPAIGPTADSIGSLLEITGHILENIAQIATTFMVQVGPEIDAIGRKFEELADPLTGAVQGSIEALTPVIESLRLNFVNPLVDGLKDILPEIQGWVEDIAPELKSISDTVGPAFKTLAEDVLPNVVSFARQLSDSVVVPVIKSLVELLTPAFGTALTEVGTGFKNAAEGLKALSGQSNEFDMGPTFTQMREDVDKDWKAAWETSDNTFWEDLGHVLFGGNIPDMGARAVESWGDDFESFFGDFAKNVGDGWNRVMSGRIFGDEQPAKAFEELGKTMDENWKKLTSGQADRDFAATFREMFPDSAAADFVDGFTQWVDDVFKGIEDGWNGLMENIGKLFGGGEGGGEESGGGHFAGRAVGGKITPEMLGVGAPEEDWLTGTINAVQTSIGEMFNTITQGFTDLTAPLVEGWNSFWSSLGTNLGEIWGTITETLGTWWTTISTNISTWWEGIRVGWDGFWGSLPAKVNEVWVAVTTWIATQALAIQTNIQNFVATVKTNWDNFWNGVNTKVQQIWTVVTTWIGTKVTEIQTNIGNFITTVRTNWDSFWNTVNTKANQIWTTITTWISTKVTEIRTNIQNFITTVKTNWDGFWNAVNQKVNAIWQTIVGWIAGKVSEIRGKIDGFISTVRTNWNTFWDTVKQKVETAWQQLVTAVSTGVENVMGFIRGLPGKIQGALGGLGDLLLAAGDAIMGGLRRGIEAGFEAVKGVVGGIAQWIKDNKGPISYDRVLLVPAGQAIMAGLREGIQDGFSPLKSTLEAITDGMVAAVTTSKMYTAGAQAALGFADGLESKSQVMAAAFESLVPSLEGSGTVTVGGSVGVGTPTPVAGNVTYVTYEAGAVPITTAAQSPEAVGSIVTDHLDELASSFTTI